MTHLKSLDALILHQSNYYYLMNYNIILIFDKLLDLVTISQHIKALHYPDRCLPGWAIVL